MNLINEAFAMAGQGGTPGAGGNFGSMMIFIVVIFAIFYFLIIRPQKKRQVDQQKFVESLKKGDEVITDSGLIGKITGVADKIITLEIADNVRVKIIKGRVVALKSNIEEPKTN